MKKHKLLLPLVGIATLVTSATPMFVLTGCRCGGKQTTTKPAPMTTDIYNITVSDNEATINGFSKKVKKNVGLLDQYSTYNFENYKKCTSMTIYGFYSGGVVPKNMTKVEFSNNDNCQIIISQRTFRDMNIKEIDFGESSVWARCQSFEQDSSEPTLTKITLSPKTILHHKNPPADTASPFYCQTKLSTIDLTRFKTTTEIENADWQDSTVIWQDGSSVNHAETGKFIISKKTLKSAWLTKFANAGWTIDQKKWTFEVKA